MAEFPAFTPSPARVHEGARALVGHHPCWSRRRYDGGIYGLEHFRVCSYCSCIHPGDMIDLLEAGDSSFESTPKLGKFLFVTPNPIAGDLVRMGSFPGRIFPKDREPADLVSSLLLATDPALPFTPTMAERVTGHFERPALEQAPTTIRWAFYAEHTTDHQWPEIWAAASRGAQHVEALPGPQAHHRHHLPERQ